MNNPTEHRNCRTILLVDDDVDSRNELQRMLLANGFADVETVPSGVAEAFF